MNQELTEEQLERLKDFVIALRSGKYKQTTDTLAIRDPFTGSKTYCCEGVAFERYGERLGYKLRWSTVSDRMIALGKSGFTEDVHVAPTAFWHDMGASSNDTSHKRGLWFRLPDGFTFRDTPRQSDVPYAHLNDSGFTFSQIADLIEWQFIPVDRREVKA